MYKSHSQNKGARNTVWFLPLLEISVLRHSKRRWMLNNNNKKSLLGIQIHHTALFSWVFWEDPMWAASKSADSPAGLLGWELILTSGEARLAFLGGVGQVEEKSLSLNRLNKFLLKTYQVLTRVTRENLKLQETHGETGWTPSPERAVLTLGKEFKSPSADQLVYLAQTDSWYLY